MTNHYTSSQEDLEKLKAFSNAINKFPKLADGESKDWEFNPKTPREVQDNFDKNKTRVEFDIYDPEYDVEKIWQVSHRTARQVIKLMEQGKYFLRITRIGDGLDTRYNIEEITG